MCMGGGGKKTGKMSEWGEREWSSSSADLAEVHLKIRMGGMISVEEESDRDEMVER